MHAIGLQSFSKYTGKKIQSGKYSYFSHNSPTELTFFYVEIEIIHHH